ncbi:MAG: flavodoxin domain-containing protein [Spirochaetota bacterium]
MEKTLLLYASSKGYARECAHRIETEMRDSGMTIDVLEVHGKTVFPSLDDYTQVIVGGGVHASMLPGSLREFCRQHEDELLRRQLFIFLCGIREAEKEEMLKANFSQKLLDHAVTAAWFGGRLRFSEHNLIVRAMLKKITGKQDDILDERLEAVNGFIGSLLSGAR